MEPAAADSSLWALLPSLSSFRVSRFRLRQLEAVTLIRDERDSGQPIKPERRALVHTTRNPVLTIYMLLTLALLGISLIAYLRSRPNTGGAASLGPFDGEHAFADLGKSSRSAQGPQAR